MGDIAEAVAIGASMGTTAQEGNVSPSLGADLSKDCQGKMGGKLSRFLELAGPRVKHL